MFGMPASVHHACTLNSCQVHSHDVYVDEFKVHVQHVRARRNQDGLGTGMRPAGQAGRAPYTILAGKLKVNGCTQPGYNLNKKPVIYKGFLC